MTQARGRTESDLSVELTLRVTDNAVAADGVHVLTLRHPTGEPLPTWSPGAHIDVIPKPGLIRQYSLCGDPNDSSSWTVGVLREPAGRGGSVYICDNLEADSLVDVRGPRNHFPLLPAERYLFIAGGIGITPILPMLATASANGTPWQLVYGGRQKSSMAFREMLQLLYQDQVTVWPQDEKGFLPLESLLGVSSPSTLVYCCGPEPLLLAVEHSCAAWPTGSLQIERFAPKQLDAPAERTGFEVELADSGLTLNVPPDKSILEIVEEAGVDIESSCREGTCGTCETYVLEGEPDHRDSILSQEEQESNEVMMICVSRAKTSRLVLEL